MNDFKDEEKDLTVPQFPVVISVQTYIRNLNLLGALYNWVQNDAKFSHPNAKIRIIKDDIESIIKEMRSDREKYQPKMKVPDVKVID